MKENDYEQAQELKCKIAEAYGQIDTFERMEKEKSWDESTTPDALFNIQVHLGENYIWTHLRKDEIDNLIRYNKSLIESYNQEFSDL